MRVRAPIVTPPSALARAAETQNPEPGQAGYPTEREIVDVVERYVWDAPEQRTRMGAATAGLGLVLGAAGTGLGAAGGTAGIVAAGVLGLGAGIGVGLHNSKHYMEGEDRFMTAYLTAFLGTCQSSLAAALAACEGLWAGAALATLAGAVTMGVAGGAVRARQSREARQAFEALDGRLNSAIDLDRMASSLREDEVGGVQKEEDFIVVGGVRVPRAGRRQ